MSHPETPANVALDPVDWFLAGWRDLPHLPLPPAKPFDREECLARLGKVKLLKTGWNWKAADIGPSLTAEEARFWLWAMVHASGQPGTRELVLEMSRQETDEPPSLERMQKGFQSHTLTSFNIRPELAPILCATFSLDEFLRLYSGLWPIEERQRRLSGFDAWAHHAVCTGSCGTFGPT